MRGKDIYVINLNKKRVLLLSGVFCVILGTTLWLGLRVGSMRINNFEDHEKLSSIAQEMGISNKELEALNLSDNLMLEDLQTESSLRASNIETETKKVAPIPSLLGITEDKISPIKVRNRDPLAKLPIKKTKKLSRPGQGRSFSIQVAAFKQKKHAITLLNKMTADGFSNIRIDQGIRYYYVRIGNSPRKEMLALENQKVKKLLNINTLIIQEDS